MEPPFVTADRAGMSASRAAAAQQFLPWSGTSGYEPRPEIVTGEFTSGASW
jgi:hypothetical protein